MTVKEALDRVDGWLMGYELPFEVKMRIATDLAYSFQEKE